MLLSETRLLCHTALARPASDLEYIRKCMNTWRRYRYIHIYRYTGSPLRLILICRFSSLLHWLHRYLRCSGKHVRIIIPLITNLEMKWSSLTCLKTIKHVLYKNTVHLEVTGWGHQNWKCSISALSV